MARRPISEGIRLRNRILITLALLLAYRLLAHVPAPGVNDQLSAASTDALLRAAGLFGGSAAGVVSIVALGVGPLVLSAIAYQVAERVIPYLSQLRDSGADDKRNRVKRLLACVIALGQAATLASNLSGPEATDYLLVTLSLFAGAVVVVWCADRISQNGIGQGTSLLIVASLLPMLTGQFSSWSSSGPAAILTGSLVVGVVILVILGLSLHQLRLPVMLAGGRTSASASYLPIGFILSGVTPVIFAVAVLSAPATFIPMLGLDASALDVIAPTSWGGLALTAVLVGFFSITYARFVFDPWQVAAALARSGAFIPGHAPGPATAELIAASASRNVYVGAGALAGLSIAPRVLGELVPALPQMPAGTLLLIVVGVGISVGSRLLAEISTLKDRSAVA
ncbi:preprotein translocase subunit SecY [Miltoncostaea oceani]|uniref:preprotein translocase subunit SecY n=1 Tax=Miltoncostaea oceani TaxID=2843216 RepID=UPI001C3D3CD8|nr:SecY family transport protein [Miltoncostaea oceani]